MAEIKHNQINNFTSNNYLEPEKGRFARYLIFYRRNRAIIFILILVALFALLTIFIRSTPTPALDLRLVIWLQRHHSSLLDRAMETLTYFGSIGTIIAAVAAAGFFFIVIGKIRSAVVIGLSLLAYPLNVLVKDLVERSRPHSALIRVLAPNSGFSFPSGHAMISLTVYGFIAYLLWIYIEPIRPRLAWLIGLSLLVFLIGLSRVYVGAHWPTDVTGGWIAGAILVFLLAELHQKITAPAQPPDQF